MHANYEARFRKEFYHEQLDANMKGRYLSYGAFYKEIKKQFAEERLLGLVKLRKAAKNLNELDAANMKKNMVEMAMMVATFLMYNALKAMGDDDDELKDNRAFNFALYQLDRFNGEMSFMNFGLITGQGWQVLKNPVPAVGTFTTMGDLLVEGLKFGAYQTGVAGLEEDDVTVQRGYMKGKYKATKELYDAVPLVRQVIDFLELEDQKNFLRK